MWTWCLMLSFTVWAWWNEALSSWNTPVSSGRKTCSFSTFRSSADLILGHFSWLASLISVLSLGYTAVQSRTLQFSSHCVWKYSYSTVKHIREHIFISPNVSVNSDWSSKIFVLNIFPPGRWMFTTIAPGLIMCWTVLNPVSAAPKFFCLFDAGK